MRQNKALFSHSLMSESAFISTLIQVYDLRLRQEMLQGILEHAFSASQENCNVIMI